MNTAKAYQSAVNPPSDKPEDVKETVDPDSIILQQKVHEWKRSTVNVEYVRKTQEQISSLLDDAMKLAVQYHQSNNHQQIINKLVQADTLRKVVNDHVS